MTQTPIKFVGFVESIQIAGDTLSYCRSTARKDNVNFRAKSFNLSWCAPEQVARIETTDGKHVALVPASNIKVMYLQDVIDVATEAKPQTEQRFSRK